MDKRRFWLEVLGCGGGAGFCWPRYSCKIQLKGWLCMLMEAQITAFTKPSLQTGLKMPFCDFNVSPLHPPRERETRNSSSLKITKSRRTSQMACPPQKRGKVGLLVKIGGLGQQVSGCPGLCVSDQPLVFSCCRWVEHALRSRVFFMVQTLHGGSAGAAWKSPWRTKTVASPIPTPLLVAFHQGLTLSTTVCPWSLLPSFPFHIIDLHTSFVPRRG